jgi:hypothetical protein
VLEKAFGLSEKAVEHIKAKFAAWKPRFDTVWWCASEVLGISIANL